jgi:uncharacterized protein YdaU (DUF1376 family)
MYYYSHNIEAFNSETRISSRLERGIYRDMLDLYHEKEEPLPLDLAELARKIVVITPEEIAAMERVLKDFFKRTEGGWFHQRATDNIQAFRESLEKSSAGGKAKAKAARAAKEAADKAAREAAEKAAKEPAPAPSAPRSGEAESNDDESESCTQPAGRVRAACTQPAIDVRAACAQPTRSVPAECAQAAIDLRVPANCKPLTVNGKPENPVAEPTLRQERIRTATPAELSIALRKRGVNTNPADPRLLAMSEQGIGVELADAACDEARRTLGDQAVLALGYVVKIVERWAREADSLAAAGAQVLGGHESKRDRERRETLHGLTGSTHEPAPEFIDINPLA